MTLIHQNATPHRSGDRPRNTPVSYFARYRSALYFLSGAGIVAGVVLNWHWLAAAGLLPILLFLPCMVMMFRCMKVHEARDSNAEWTGRRTSQAATFPAGSAA